ncbi:CPBP family intramembrane glutamic endopeptidase [Lacinutrix sp. Hel_I_90]|uniref:CPBP family intramembrane glutamic endopeptidase n=1 Tax=Lacinutrix sp. Hel_I_90 TaxID=1249999 RepID=UPI0006980C13|nr:CPBP family intramembrane glutamic endopeptidase [Lacinutrix sp. Hel_I_90]
MKNKLSPILEITIVLSIMHIVKAVADHFKINGAGSIAIWCAIFIATLFMKRRKAMWRDLGLLLPKEKRQWFINIGLALATVLVVFLLMGLILDPILSHFGLEKPAEVANRFQFFLGKPILFITYLITVVWIGAALGEELLMRGYLLNRLTDVFGTNKIGWIVAMLIHAIIFGMLHVYQGLAGIITTTFIALIFGTVYLVAKKRLFPVILAHLIINTISLTAFYLTGGAVN